MRKTIAILTIFVAGAALASGQLPRPMVIPTDANARYTILEIGGTHPNRTIVTRREGSSGVTYSTRLYNCVAQTTKYLGTGSSIEAMRASRPDPRMSEIVPRSIAFYVGKEACRR